MDLRRFSEEKWVRNGKIFHLWAEPVGSIGTKNWWYRYPLCSGEVVPVPLKVVPVPIGSKGLVPVPIKVVPVPMLPATLFLNILHC